MITRHHSNARMSQVVEYPLSGTAVVTAGVVASSSRHRSRAWASSCLPSTRTRSASGASTMAAGSAGRMRTW